MSRRQPDGAPPLLVELAIALAFGALLALASPDVLAWLSGAPPVRAALETCRAESKHHTALAARYAAVIVGCLNGDGITDGERTLACREIR